MVTSLLIINSKRNLCIKYFDVKVVPSVGEKIFLDYKPYIVKEREFSYESNIDFCEVKIYI